MEIEEVSFKEFDNVFNNSYFIFGSGKFNNLNKDKVKKVYYFLFKEKKYRLGLVIGEKDNILKSPFSAPFGGFLFLSTDIKIEYIEFAVDLLINWAKKHSINKIQITMPPTMYNETFISKQINTLYRKGFVLNTIELNYAIFLENTELSSLNYLSRAARKNLNISKNSNLRFVKGKSNQEFNEAYQIISKNRASRGYPLRMTWEQVYETSKVLQADSFLVRYEEEVIVASAIVFHVNKEVAQVIYWGDIPEYSNFKVMNFLAHELFSYYKEKGIKVVDVGPSTENSIPNYGLCDFKESIGCSVSQKISMVLDLK